MRSGCVFRLEVILVILAVSYASSVSDHDDADHRNGTGHEEAAHHDDHHPTHHYVIYFMTLAIALGVGTQQILDRYIPTLPYTAVLLVEGLVIGMLVEYAGSAGFPKLVESIEMWEAIDPHLMLYMFLPALLFGDAMHLNVHLFYRTFWQCMLLASPGVMLGTGLTALCAKFILPYNWSWSLSLAFGSILAATDPVAVVALLNAVGASPILTMQITGESLLNDGTAIVVFNIFFSVVDSGRSYTPGELIAYFTQLALGGPALGLCFGLFFLWWMRKLSRTTSHQDSVLQISLTVCCAYGSFFAAEELFEVSGVLCTVTAALVLAEYVHPAIANEAAMSHVWHYIEYTGNTLIFLLAGLITGKSIWSAGTDFHGQIGWEDALWVLVMFVCMTLIRAIMMALFFPALKRIGYGTNLKDIFFMTWGGLRGAVGLALALVLRGSLERGNDCSPAAPIEACDPNGMRVILMVSGLAALTLIINGVSSGPILKWLDMISDTPAKKTLLEKIRLDIAKSLREEAVEMVNAHGEHSHPEQNIQQLRQHVSIMRAENEHRDTSSSLIEDWTQKLADSNVCFTSMLRELFLSALLQQYWEQIKVGRLPRKSVAAHKLLVSVHSTIDGGRGLGTPLHDWQFLGVEPSGSSKPTGFEAILTLMKLPLVYTLRACSKVACYDRPALPSSSHHCCDFVHDFFFEYNQTKLIKEAENLFYMLTSFIQAHEHTQKMLTTMFGEGGGSEYLKTVLAESRAEVETAKKTLERVDKDCDTCKAVHQHAAAFQLPRIMLLKQAHKIEQYKHQGILNEKDEMVLMEEVTENLVSISYQHKRLFAHKLGHQEKVLMKQARSALRSSSRNIWNSRTRIKKHRTDAPQFIDEGDEGDEDLASDTLNTRSFDIAASEAVVGGSTVRIPLTHRVAGNTSADIAVTTISGSVAVV